VKDFDLFGIETHLIPPNPHGLRAKRTSPKTMVKNANPTQCRCVPPLFADCMLAPPRHLRLNEGGGYADVS
jgi:hypothetical protein